MISCGARLAVFDIAELREVTAYDELELDTLGDRKTALFLIMSDTDDSFNFLISMCYTQLFIEALTHDKTIIMIAHRLKTVRNADQILVLDNAHIVQRGTHAELIQQKGLYADFVSARQEAIGWKLAQ